MRHVDRCTTRSLSSNNVSLSLDARGGGPLRLGIVNPMDSQKIDFDLVTLYFDPIHQIQPKQSIIPENKVC